MYDITQSAVLLEGEKSKLFGIGQKVVQGCSMLPIFISNHLLVEAKEAGIGIKKDVKAGGR